MNIISTPFQKKILGEHYDWIQNATLFLQGLVVRKPINLIQH